MPFTALKPLVIPHILPEVEGCAPPNAVYGIETAGACDAEVAYCGVVRRLMPFTALKLSVPVKSNCKLYKVVRRLMPFTALKPGM